MIIHDNGHDRPMTAEEIAQYEISASQAAITEQQIADQIAAQQAAKESARAKLAALGLTEEEIAALVG